MRARKKRGPRKPRAKGQNRDKETRFELSVFEAWRREGQAAFARWFLADAGKLGGVLRDARRSYDTRAALRACKLTLDLALACVEEPAVVETEEDAEVAAWLARYEAAGEPERRAMRWSVGATERQERDRIRREAS